MGQLVLFQPMTEPQNSASSGMRENSWSWTNSRYKGTSKNASSMPGSDRVNHRCKKCMRTMVAGDEWPPFLAIGIVGSRQIDQRLPWNNFVLLPQEIALAGFLHA